MKNILAVIVVVVILHIVFAGGKEPKKYRAELTIEQWGVIYQCLDNSNESHSNVKLALGWLNQQLQPQLDTLKKK